MAIFKAHGKTFEINADLIRAVMRFNHLLLASLSAASDVRPRSSSRTVSIPSVPLDSPLPPAVGDIEPLNRDR